MTRRITLIIGIAVAALAVGVPVASADPWFADRQQVDFWNYDAQTGRKTADTSPGVAPGDLAGLYSTVSDLSGHDLGIRRDARSGWHGRDLTYTEAPGDPAVDVASDGGEFKWPELGIGLGIGVLLMIGLYFGTKATRHRSLAH